MKEIIMALLMPFISVDHSEHRCLAETIYYEARGESTAGKKAVANVVLNRVNHHRWPDTICKVVYQKGQFSWSNKKYKIREQEAWVESKAIARAIMIQHQTNKRKDNTNGATFFSTGYHHPKTTRVAKIGSHVFFK